MTRSRIIYLRNDYKELMNTIEKHVHEHFASLSASEDPAAQPGPNADETPLRDHEIPEPLQPPFAIVNSVEPGGPADTAGLKAGDKIRSFGYVNLSNHENLKRVAECVQGNEGVRVFPSRWLIAPLG